MSEFPMTVQGAHALEEKMKHPKGMLRPQISQAIAKARELSDLKEDAEYHAAHEQQGMVEMCTHDTEAKLSNTQVTDVTTIPYNGKMILGTTVDIANTETDETMTYQIAGDDEADIKGGKISVNSPITRALIGKTKGDTVLMRTPGGDAEYEAIEVRHI